MSEDNKDKVNTSDIGEPQEVETDQDSTNGGSFVADILGALGIGNQGSSKCVPADEKSTSNKDNKHRKK